VAEQGHQVARAVVVAAAGVDFMNQFRPSSTYAQKRIRIPSYDLRIYNYNARVVVG
jgi:hypothetical protein